ncbi:electron transfer flavoprotein subunit alpha/FixB family protein [Nakamurella sp. PAMC28650]|jgi:electron transfer flavoprotein alpha subunit|uniref:electron transfer flavoprotein subunit alpha/FixB family protein n=1 Tax=Nakamurella sp. PAMC28650 TaxID=2762325 RepID=UPI00164D5FB8|nr:electron transfer flavoprotein subunit alpha/FixB family protein [Nakamurella sp. PAMC28650]QNK80793.1 electron transfer flavoprotein subunit alpha/FixB family protein [Nakamurella sp. PAMC28650]
MSDVLVLVEHADGGVKKLTVELLVAAARIGTPVAVVVGAVGTAAALSEQLGAAGASKIFAAESADPAEWLLTPQVAALQAAVAAGGVPAAVLVAATFDGREIAGRLAVRLDSGVLADVVDVALEDGVVVATLSVFGGAYTTRYQVSRGVPVISVRGNAIEGDPVAVLAPPVVVLATSVDAVSATRVSQWLPEDKGDRPELGGAKIVVSGGRGVGSADNFHVVEELADVLGGAVGASRAAVDSGYYPHQFQVGQTGTTVSPQLYVALGISGAIQHRAGMQTSKTIVAVNKDTDAPIFEIADFGVVGDLFTVAPQLASAIKTRKG